MKHLNIVIFAFVYLLLPFLVKAQAVISGPQNCIVPGQPYTYAVSGVNGPNIANIHWTTPGVIAGTGGLSYKYGALNISVTFPAGFTSGYINVDGSGVGSSSLFVTSQPRLPLADGGQLLGPGMVYTSVPTIQIQGNDPSSGACNGAGFVYNWQKSSSAAGPFTDISGVTGSDYTFPTPATPTTIYLRRGAKLGTSSIFYTPVISVVVAYEPVSGGGIYYADPVGIGNYVDYGTKPMLIETVAARGHDCDVNGMNFVWQQSTNGGSSWVDIGTGINYPAAAPGITTDLTQIRRKVTCGSTVAYSNVVTIYITPFTAGTISLQRNIGVVGQKPPPVSQTLPSGGICSSSSYAYVWQLSTNGGSSWQNIGTTADFPAATAPVLTATGNVLLRRQVTCGAQTLFSNVLSFQVYEPGTLADNQNYVRTTEVWKTGVTDAATATALSVGDKQQSTAYFDALGRPLETIQQQASGTGKDLITYNAYDNYGRAVMKYLPYTYASGSSDPFAGNGKIKFQPDQDQAGFYQGMYPGDPAYQQTNFESSPMNRVMKVLPQGNNWVGAGRGTAASEQVNTPADGVRIWNIAGDQLVVPVSANSYIAGQLLKDVMTDEQGHQTVTYKDKSGQIVLKKVQLLSGASLTASHDGWMCTYYVYDNLHQLRFVIPPLAVDKIKSNWVIPAEIANELCYQYQYDARGRMIVKKMPGVAVVQMVYDNWDRQVFSQDGRQAFKTPTHEWLATTYDGLSRPVMTAIYPSNATRDQLQTSMNTAAASGVLTYTIPGVANLEVPNRVSGQALYEASQSITFLPGFETETNAEFTTNINTSIGGTTEQTVVTNPLPSFTGFQPLTYTYYDDYSYSNAKSINTGYYSKFPTRTDAQAWTQLKLPKGQATGTKVRILGTDTWLTTSIFFDDKLRPIQQRADNARLGEDITNIQYDFTGKTLATYLDHGAPRDEAIPKNSVLATMQYDVQGRLLEVKQRLNDNAALERIIAQEDYDELGRLKHKKLGVTTSAMETLQNDYNIRGWLTAINKDFVETDNSTANWFGQELGYDTWTTGNQYNGNIAGLKWKTKGNGIPRKYDFAYDNSDRLTGADFAQQNQPGSGFTKDKADFSVSALGYDLNGNITSMTQRGLKNNAPTTIDQLTYAYISPNSNKLAWVADGTGSQNTGLGDFTDAHAGIDYARDTTGSLTQDLNKGISAITYNHLSLPELITITGKGTIRYQYDANGVKLSKVVTDNTQTPAKITTTDYILGFVYQNDSLQFVSHEEGRVRLVYKLNTAPRYVYDYFVKDHLGNIRMVLTESSDTAQYAATLETGNSAVENALFSNINNTRTALPTGYPADNTTNPNAYAAKLNAQTGQKTGPSLVLRVMAGDVITVGAKAYYTNTGANTRYASASDMITSLLLAFASGGQADGGHIPTGSNSPMTNTTMTTNVFNQIKQTPGSEDDVNKPKAYLNFVLFDDQFNMVAGNSGERQVQASLGSLQTLTVSPMTIKSTGFIYIYVSNESNQDVYFDNLVVNHTSGPLLEETHYYPFGLTMAGISSSALKGRSYPGNRIKYNGKELQNQEFSDGTGLEEYDYGARFQDPQLGCFTTIDPLSEANRRWSPYSYAADNPVRFVDQDGMIWDDPKKDKAIAERLQTQISGRLETENDRLNTANKEVTRIQEKIDRKGPSDKLQQRLQDAKAEVQSIQGTINELTSASSELTEMGSDKVTQKFTFKEVSGSEGDTYKKDGVITMEIVGDPNAIHESTHGYQIYKGEIIGGNKGANLYPGGEEKLFSMEVAAYKRQFAFDPVSVQDKVPSYYGNVKTVNDINRYWLIGINNNGNFIYGRTLLGKSYDAKTIKKYLDDKKRHN